MNPEPESRDDDLAELLMRSGLPTPGPEPDEEAILAFLFGHPTEEQRRMVERSLVESPGFRTRIDALRAESARETTTAEQRAFSQFEPEPLTPLALKAALRRAGYEPIPAQSPSGERWWNLLWTWRTGLAMATAALLLVIGGPILIRAFNGTGGPGSTGQDQVAIIDPGTRDTLGATPPPSAGPDVLAPRELPAGSSPDAVPVPVGDSTATQQRAPILDEPTPAPPEAIAQRASPRPLAPGERVQIGTTPDASSESVELAKRIAAAMGEGGNTDDGRFLVEFGTLGSSQPARASRPGQPAPERVRMLPYRVVDRWTGRGLPEKELRIVENDATAAAPADRLLGVLREQPWAGRVVAVRLGEVDLIGTGRGAPEVGDRLRIIERGPEILRSDTGTLAGYRTRPVGIAVVTTVNEGRWTARVESSSIPPATGMSVVRSDEP